MSLLLCHSPMFERGMFVVKKRISLLGSDRFTSKGWIRIVFEGYSAIEVPAPVFPLH